ncbi:hypothetical protein QS257_01790 [Terrilactibacillus sp. S3-3]|nr:hypothetical protein QS257_01790 [Terrilactibacillus sp. S3-3]
MNKFFKIVLSIVVAAAIVIIGGFVYHAAVNPKPAAHQENKPDHTRCGKNSHP